MISVIVTTIKNLGAKMKKKQGCIKLIKSDRKDIYNVAKDFCFKQMLLFLFIK